MTNLFSAPRRGATIHKPRRKPGERMQAHASSPARGVTHGGARAYGNTPSVLVWSSSCRPPAGAGGYRWLRPCQGACGVGNPGGVSQQSEGLRVSALPWKGNANQTQPRRGCLFPRLNRVKWATLPGLMVPSSASSRVARIRATLRFVGKPLRGCASANKEEA